jgi:hypothetical protein
MLRTGVVFPNIRGLQSTLPWNWGEEQDHEIKGKGPDHHTRLFSMSMVLKWWLVHTGLSLHYTCLSVINKQAELR